MTTLGPGPVAGYDAGADQPETFGSPPPRGREGLGGGVLAALIGGLVVVLLLAFGSGVAVGLLLGHRMWFGPEWFDDEGMYFDEQFHDEAFFGTPTPLTPGQPVNATLGEREGRAYTFEAEAGQTAAIRMQRRGGDREFDELDPYLVLFDEDGVPLAEDDDGGGDLNAALSYYLEDGGTYTVGATSIAGGGDFNLLLDLE